MILDATCGGRHLWNDKNRADTVYIDQRVLPPGTIPIRPNWCVKPDIIASFTNMPFSDATFEMVVYDPPHIIRDNPSKSFLRTKYGELRSADWQDTIAKGFAECWRVLKPGGTLVFKWSNANIPTSDVLALFAETPLFKCNADVSWHIYRKPKPCPDNARAFLDKCFPSADDKTRA